MTKLERLQALEREATKGPWVWDEDGDLMALWELEPCDGDIVLGMYTGDKPEPADAALIAALRNAAPDLIRVALAAQWYIECLEAVLERRPVRGLDEAQHGYEAALIALDQEHDA